MYTLEETYLECINDYSCKFYIARLVAEDDGTFSVPVCYGSLGTMGYQYTRADHAAEQVAHKAYDAIIRQKERRGYEISHRPDYLANAFSHG